MITGIEVPLEWAALVCAIGVGAGLWAGRVRTARQVHLRRERSHDPLRELLKPEVLSQAVDMAARRDAQRATSRAVLQGRIDQLTSYTAWNSETRSVVREHVAAVMRTGLRRGDRMAINGSGRFTIVVPDADERAAVRIADRLRRKLNKMRLPPLGSNARLSASFGVAADNARTGEDALYRRARRALDAAMTHGNGHVVQASEIEEIMLLPAPAPSAPTAATAA